MWELWTTSTKHKEKRKIKYWIYNTNYIALQKIKLNGTQIFLFLLSNGTRIRSDTFTFKPLASTHCPVLQFFFSLDVAVATQTTAAGQSLRLLILLETPQRCGYDLVLHAGHW